MKTMIKPLIFLILVVFVLFAVVWYDLSRFLSLEYVRSQLDIWILQVRENFFIAAVMFFLLYAVITLLSIPGAAVMALAAGTLFGLWRGAVIVSCASTLSATLSFLTARFFLRESVSLKFKNQLEKINKGLEKDGAFHLFALRLVPIVPFSVINMGMGLTRMPVLVYVFVSQIGMLAGTFAYVNAGRSLSNIKSLSGIISPQVWISFLLLACIPYISKRIVDFLKAKRIYKSFAVVKPQKFDYNVAVIGAGSGGLAAADIAASLKAKVILFEKAEMSGSCLNRRCIPSKALISISRQASLYRRGKDIGVQYTRPVISFSKVMKTVQSVIASIAPHDSAERYESLGVRCVKEEAFITSPWEIRTKTKTVAVQKIIIAAGSVPEIPDVPGLTEARPYTTDTIWSLTANPGRLLIIGGGPAGCALGRAFSLLGASVTLVQRADQLLHREDADVAKAARESLERADVTVYTHSVLKEVKKSVRGQLTAVLEHTQTKTKTSTAFDTVLVTAGRKVHLHSFGGGTLNLAINPDGTIATDEYLRTSVPNIYAVGDAAGSYQFTHTASHMAWYAAMNALFGAVKKFALDYTAVSSAAFLEPEIGRVGLNEKEAQIKNIAYEVTWYNMDDLDRFASEQKTAGFIKVLTVPKKDVILGAAVVAERGEEILGEFMLAMKYKLGLNKLLRTMHPYPAFIEAAKAAAGVRQRARVPKKLLKLTEAFFRLGLKKV